MMKPFLYIKKSANKGRAVFTKEKILANTIIEESPVIVMSKEERVHLDKTLLHDYIFEWGKVKDNPIAIGCCVALGYIPIYNHSYKSNCEYYMDFEKETIQIKTVVTIESEEELTINYNGDWDDDKKVWFDVV